MNAKHFERRLEDSSSRKNLIKEQTAQSSHIARTESRNCTKSRKVSFYVITTRVAKKFFPQPMKGKSVTISSLNGSGAVKAMKKKC